MQMPADRVESALRQGITSDNPVNRHGQSLNKTERLETFDGIFRTGRIKPATLRQ